MSSTFETLPALPDDESPLVVSVPHAGTAVPVEDAPLLALEGPALLRDADLFVDRLCRDVPGHGVPLVRALVSRYVLDVNRAPDDVDREWCPSLDRPTRVSARGLGWRGAAQVGDARLAARMPAHRASASAVLDARATAGTTT